MKPPPFMLGYQPEPAKTDLAPANCSHLAQNIDDAADQVGRWIDRVNAIAFIVIALTRNVRIPVPVRRRQVAVIDIAIAVPRRPLPNFPGLTWGEATIVLLS